MTGQEALDAMREIATRDGDAEVEHAEADGVLCALLRSLGFNALVDTYELVDKWYA